MKQKILVGALVIGLFAGLSAAVHASEAVPAALADAATETTATEEAIAPQVCDVTDQAIATGGIGCITCGTNEWCDNWCGPGLGRCAQNLGCGIFYKKYCYCAGDPPIE